MPETRMHKPVAAGDLVFSEELNRAGFAARAAEPGDSFEICDTGTYELVATGRAKPAAGAPLYLAANGAPTTDHEGPRIGTIVAVVNAEAMRVSVALNA